MLAIKRMNAIEIINTSSNHHILTSETPADFGDLRRF